MTAIVSQKHAVAARAGADMLRGIVRRIICQCSITPPPVRNAKMVARGRLVPLERATVTRLDSFVCLAATMRHLFICTLLCLLAIPGLAQTTRSVPQRHAKSSDLS